MFDTRHHRVAFCVEKQWSRPVIRLITTLITSQESSASVRKFLGSDIKENAASDEDRNVKGSRVQKKERTSEGNI